MRPCPRRDFGDLGLVLSSTGGVSIACVEAPPSAIAASADPSTVRSALANTSRLRSVRAPNSICRNRLIEVRAFCSDTITYSKVLRMRSSNSYCVAGNDALASFMISSSSAGVAWTISGGFIVRRWTPMARPIARVTTVASPRRAAMRARAPATTADGSPLPVDSLAPA